MKRLSVDHHTVKLVHAQAYEPGLDGVIPLRYPPEILAQMPEGTMPGIARYATGVEVQLCGEITEVAFHLRVLDSDGYGFYAELFRGDAKILSTWRLDHESRDVQVGRFAVTGCLNRTAPLRLLLPTHCTIEVIAVEVNDNAVLQEDFTPYDYRALPGSRGLTWGVYGDSIAHGANVTCPSCAWVDLTARMLTLNPINLAIGGYGVAEPSVAMHLATRYDFDVLSLHMGANCADAEAFIGQYMTFLDIIRDAQPTLPIVLVTPIFHGADLGRQDNRMQCVRDAITRVHASRVAAGDAYLDLIDGLSLLHGTAGLNGDGVHLHEYGAMCYAANLAPCLSSLWHPTVGKRPLIKMAP